MTDRVLTDTVFEQFELHPLLQQGLADCGFVQLTPVQALTLPVTLAGRDVAGQAQTGTGKTCAFLVTAINHLLTHSARAERKDTDPRALIVAPTRELAIQIHKDAKALSAHTGLEIALVYGGVDYDKQRQKLRGGCDIIIATPGRLLDYYKQQVFGLNNVEIVVLDEADRMFDLGFIRDVRYIFRRLPPRTERQALLYSATLGQRVLELAYEHMNDAEKLEVKTEHVTADRVRQRICFPSQEEKPALLVNWLKQDKPERSIVFVNTRAAVDRVRRLLGQHGYRVGMLSGQVAQDKRQKVLKRFQDSKLDVLVCTDVAARGLHIPHVSHVFNYDLPQDAEDYVHRIGRTGRLGEAGEAISFACDRYAMSLPEIEQYIEQKIDTVAIDDAWLVMPEPVAKIEEKPKSTSQQGKGAGNKSRRQRHRNRRRGGQNRSQAKRASHRNNAATTEGNPSAPASVEGGATPKTQASSGQGKGRNTSSRSRRRNSNRRRGKSGSQHAQDTNRSSADNNNNRQNAQEASGHSSRKKGQNQRRRQHQGNHQRRSQASHAPRQPARNQAGSAGKVKSSHNGKAATSRVNAGPAQNVPARKAEPPRKKGLLRRLTRRLFK